MGHVLIVQRIGYTSMLKELLITDWTRITIDNINVTKIN